MFKKIVATVGSLVVAGSAFAQTAPTNAQTLGASLSMADALAGILAVAGVLMLFYVGSKGVDLVIRKVKSA